MGLDNEAPHDTCFRIFKFYIPIFRDLNLFSLYGCDLGDLMPEVSRLVGFRLQQADFNSSEKVE